MSDQLLYSLVARGTNVLAEHSFVAGNAHLLAHRILEKLPAQDSRVSYSQDRHLFHIVTQDGITFMCMANEDLGRRIPFAFLEDIKERYFAAFRSSCATAAAYTHNEEFAPVLQQRMAYFSNDRNADAINRVRGGLGEVRNIMIENIDKVLDRGERIELLVDKTDSLQSEAFAFKRESRRLKHSMWWKNARLLGIIAFVLLLLVYVIACFACSPTLQC